VLYDMCANRKAFVMGQANQHSGKDTGSSFGLSDLLGTAVPDAECDEEGPC
jgi:hypothetical protein